MQKNMGPLDRALRVLVTIVIGILYLAGQISGTAAIILGIFALIFIITSIVSFCPLYFPLKLSTLKKKDA